MALTIGASIAKLRREKGVTQGQLAAAVGISAPAVSRWEKGSGYPDIALLPAIARFFGVTLDTLMDFHACITDEEADVICREGARICNCDGYDAAIAYLENASHEFPNCKSITLSLGSMLINSSGTYGDSSPDPLHAERIRRGIEYLIPITQDPILGGIAAITLGYGYIYLHDYPEYEKLISRISEPDFARSERWRLVSSYHILTKTYDEGIPELEQICSDMCFSMFQALQKLSMMFERSGDEARCADTVEALIHAQEALGIDISRIELIYWLMRYRFSSGDDESGVRWLERLILEYESLEPDGSRDTARMRRIGLIPDPDAPYPIKSYSEQCALLRPFCARCGGLAGNMLKRVEALITKFDAADGQ